MQVATLGAEGSGREHLLRGDEDPVGSLCSQKVGMAITGNPDSTALLGERRVEEAEIRAKRFYCNQLDFAEWWLENAISDSCCER